MIIPNNVFWPGQVLLLLQQLDSVLSPSHPVTSWVPKRHRLLLIWRNVSEQLPHAPHVVHSVQRLIWHWITLLIIVLCQICIFRMEIIQRFQVLLKIQMFFRKWQKSFLCLFVLLLLLLLLLLKRLKQDFELKILLKLLQNHTKPRILQVICLFYFCFCFCFCFFFLIFNLGNSLKHFDQKRQNSS